MDHPPTVYVREDAIVPRLDAWLAEIVTPEALASAQATPPDVVAQHVAVRTAMADCDLRIKRLLESIENGRSRSHPKAMRATRMPMESRQAREVFVSSHSRGLWCQSRTRTCSLAYRSDESAGAGSTPLGNLRRVGLVRCAPRF
jgi:hypothetical protein